MGPKVKVKITQLYLILCDPVDYTVHGTLQVRVLGCRNKLIFLYWPCIFYPTSSLTLSISSNIFLWNPQGFLYIVPFIL